MYGKLYLVATPIGNLEDITLRAIRVLKEVDVIAAEDTRHTLKLLNHLEISKPLICYHRHNEDVKSKNLINLLLDGKNVALVSDAGTPVISDPGEEIVKVAIKNNIEIVPIPGACALISALISSGLDSNEFTFIGFLPLNKKLRKEKLLEIKNSVNTMILYEAPHKLKNTLADLSNITDNRVIFIARELTKIHEEFIRGSAQELLNKIDTPKGEYVIIIDGSKDLKKDNDFIGNLPINEQYDYYLNLGLEKKEIIKLIAKNKGVPKNEIYIQFLK